MTITMEYSEYENLLKSIESVKQERNDLRDVLTFAVRTLEKEGNEIPVPSDKRLVLGPWGVSIKKRETPDDWTKPNVDIE